MISAWLWIKRICSHLVAESVKDFVDVFETLDEFRYPHKPPVAASNLCVAHLLLAKTKYREIAFVQGLGCRVVGVVAIFRSAATSAQRLRAVDG